MAELALNPGLRAGLVGHVEFLKLSQRQNEMKAEVIMSLADRKGMGPKCIRESSWASSEHWGMWI